MNIRWPALGLLIPFVLFTAYSMMISDESLLDFGYRLVSEPDTAQVVFDLYIMALLAIVWMYYVSQALPKKWYWIPFAVLTLVFVSVGPLLYLVLRPKSSSHTIPKNKVSPA